MIRYTPFYCLLFSSFLTISLDAQTILAPGDIAVLGVVTDLTGCDHDGSDEISFVCFKDITAFSTIHITDNGWETANPGSWGDSEGTLRFLRVGPTIPAGTVITFQGINDNGLWTYQMISPDNGWVITEVNTPGGPFDLESGGDQFYFLQNGTWDNLGGGLNLASYSGEVIYGFNTLGTWAADGSTHQSNLHPSVMPCYHMSSGGEDYYKYTNMFAPAIQLEWWHRNQDGGNWSSFTDCFGYNAAFPVYPSGFSIQILPTDMHTSCLDCDGCRPFDTSVTFHLPPGYTFDVLYTDGTDTFELLGIQNFHIIPVTVSDTTIFSLVSVSESGGCPMPADFSAEATINVPNNNPGTHNSLYICPDYGVINLAVFLGVHDPGGTWYPPLDPIFGTYYVSNWGPGTYTYIFKHQFCDDDTASIDVFHIDTAGTLVDIGCDINGTPTDITDDRMVVTVDLMINWPDFGPLYQATPLHYGVPTGSITPDIGVNGEPTVFLLDPGTATQTNLSLEVEGFIPIVCDWKIPLPPPGYCSDPCDHSMFATITGDTEICPNSCPDNPATIYVDIFGGEDDWTIDLAVTAPGHPVWSFPGISVEANTEIEVCIDEVPAPVFDPGAGTLILPKFLTGLEVSILLENVFDDYHCSAILDNPEHILTIYPLPPINSISLAYCEGQALSVEMTQYNENISFDYDVAWYDENPFQGGSEINPPTSANLLNVVELWAYIEDGNCANAVHIPVTILEQPDLDSVGPLQLCYGNGLDVTAIPIVNQSDSLATYTYHLALPPDSTNQLDTTFFVPLDTTTIYVLATTGMCYDTLPVDIAIQAYPDFVLEALPCDLILETYSVLFTTSADSIHASAGVVNHHVTGQDTISGIPNDTSLTIEILNPSGLCRDTFQIVAPNCNCPQIDQPIAGQAAYAICEGTPVPTLTASTLAGLQVNWYDVPSGGVPLLQNSLSYQPPGLISTIYYAESFDPANGCVSLRTAVPLDVFPVPDLQMLGDPVICDMESLDFSSTLPAILNGVPGTGQWYDLLTNQTISGVIQPQDGGAWYYLFTSTQGGCSASDTIVAEVNPLPSLDIYTILCDDVSLTYDLAFISDADVLNISVGNLSTIPGTDSFLVAGVPFDTDVVFDLEISGSGCTASFTQIAPDCSCPPLLNAANHQICSDQGLVDLSAFTGLGVNGNWQLISVPSGSNPATLAGSTLQGIGADEGLYTLLFVRSTQLADCIDTAFFTLQLHESPLADAGNNASTCAPDQVILAGNAAGTNVLINWQTNGGGSILNPNVLNTSYTPTLNDILNGAVNFTLTATDPTGFCPSSDETITVAIDGSAYFIVDPVTINYCDTLDSLIDLDTWISFGNTNGTWFFPDTVSAPVTSSSQFNPSDLAPGQYTVFYTTSNATPPCVSDTGTLNLTIENCTCPSVAISNPAFSLCSESGVTDLNDLLITTEPGAWSIVSSPAGPRPAILSGSDFITDQSNAGTYRLRFTLSQPIQGCPSFAEIDLEVIQTPAVDILTIACADDLQSWQTMIITSAETVISAPGTITTLGNNHYLLEQIPLNTNLLLTGTNGNGQCVYTQSIQAPDCDCDLNVSNLPVSVSLCPEESITLEPQITGGKGDITSYWIVSNDSLYQNTLDVDEAGTYQFISFDSLGCREEALVDVHIYPEMVPDITPYDITCPGDQNGSIILYSIQGGNAPFLISFNGSPYTGISTFPYEIASLSAGTYVLALLDASNCAYSLTLTVSSASSEIINLGPDQTILAGDSLWITPNLSFVPDSFYWAGNLESLDPALLENWIKPDADQYFELFAIDGKGCLYVDQLAVRVLLTSSVYVPNVFSPNDDGINDLLAPKGDPSVILFEYFEIFSRWGELVYAAKDFAPGSNTGWDGKTDEQEANPGVYVYRLSATNKRGKTITAFGDVTLIR